MEEEEDFLVWTSVADTGTCSAGRCLKLSETQRKTSLQVQEHCHQQTGCCRFSAKYASGSRHACGGAGRTCIWGLAVRGGGGGGGAEKLQLGERVAIKSSLIPDRDLF
jgi:hypothetical protein